MIVKIDICPKSGLKREIEYIEFKDDKIKKTIFLNCDLNYYHKETNEFIGKNILTKDAALITLSNEVNLEGIGEYDYWKGVLNDVNSMLEKEITGFDSYCAYIILKAYGQGKFN
jgi:hypothetical protein